MFVRPWDQVYEINRLMETYSDSVRAAYEGFFREALERDLVLEDEPRFHFIERVWPKKFTDPPYFTFSYYNVDSFATHDNLDPLLKAISADGTNFQTDMKKLLHFVQAKRSDRAIHDAEKAFHLIANRHHRGEPFDRGELHHHVAALFSRIPRTGAIPGALMGVLSRLDASGPHDAVFACTGQSEGIESRLPNLATLWWSVDRVRPIERELTQDPVAKELGDNTAERAIDTYLRDPGGIGRSSADRENVLMMYMPVFEMHRRQAHHGGLVGWLFQFLALKVEDQQQSMAVIRKVLQCSDAGREYVQACHANLDFIALGMASHSLNEAFSQEVVPTGDCYQQFWHLSHFIGGWKVVNPEDNIDNGIQVQLVRPRRPDETTPCVLLPRDGHLPHGERALTEYDSRLCDRLRSRYQYSYGKVDLMLHWAGRHFSEDADQLIQSSLGYFLYRVLRVLQKEHQGAKFGHLNTGIFVQHAQALQRELDDEINRHVLGGVGEHPIWGAVQAYSQLNNLGVGDASTSPHVNAWRAYQLFSGPTWYHYKPASQNVRAAAICECDYKRIHRIIEAQAVHNGNGAIVEPRWHAKINVLSFLCTVTHASESLSRCVEGALNALANPPSDETLWKQKLPELFDLVCRKYCGTIRISFHAGEALATVESACVPTTEHAKSTLPADPPAGWSGTVVYELALRDDSWWESGPPPRAELPHEDRAH